MYLVYKIDKHALMITVTKTWEVGFSNHILLILHCTFANANTSFVV